MSAGAGQNMEPSYPKFFGNNALVHDTAGLSPRVALWRQDLWEFAPLLFQEGAKGTQ